MSISINVFYVRRPQHPRSFFSCFYKKYLTQFVFGWFAKAPPTPYTTLAVHQKPDLSLKLYYSRELNWTGFYHLEISFRSYCWPVGPDPTHLIKTLLLLLLLYFQFCTFKHAGKMCDIVWTKEAWNVTMGECSDYSGRATFTVSRNSSSFHLLNMIMSQNNAKVNLKFWQFPNISQIFQSE